MAHPDCARQLTRVDMHLRAARRYTRISVKQCAIDSVCVSKLVDADMHVVQDPRQRASTPAVLMGFNVWKIL